MVTRNLPRPELRVGRSPEWGVLGGSDKVPMKQQACGGAHCRPRQTPLENLPGLLLKAVTVLAMVESGPGGLLVVSFLPTAVMPGVMADPAPVRQGGWEHTNVSAPRESLAETLSGVFPAEADGIGLPCSSSLRHAFSILAFRVAELSQ